ncbi:sigmaY antisigma factor component [Bacillus sp. FJAT-26390]|uniref:sigmaY antisigma factor component n=1 Tax=Bacillus sp. FJAT-26390 TaxID=1743142 RepID=UPI000807DD7A|nr:sigmaY antisigma factor component [Bacillus sp. FJAT-26390]OBZ08527.1 sigmaY antisigma factor component [Bacillus sp. FJAT-26390]
MEELKVLPIWAWILLAAVLIAQSTWLFIDARKRDSMPWLWGIWGLIQTPMPFVFYFIFVRSGWFRRNRNKDK